MTADELEREIRRNPTMNERFLLGLLDEARGKVERVSEVRRTMGYAAEAWTREDDRVAQRLQHFSDELAAALAGQDA